MQPWRHGSARPPRAMALGPPKLAGLDAATSDRYLGAADLSHRNTDCISAEPGHGRRKLLWLRLIRIEHRSILWIIMCVPFANPQAARDQGLSLRVCNVAKVHPLAQRDSVVAWWCDIAAIRATSIILTLEYGWVSLALDKRKECVSHSSSGTPCQFAPKWLSDPALHQRSRAGLNEGHGATRCGTRR